MPTDAPADPGAGKPAPVRIDHRIDLRLPLSIAALLAGAVALVTGLAYLEMRDEAVASANARLGEVRRRLADLTAKSTASTLEGVAKFAARAEIRDAFGPPGEAVDGKTRAFLEPLVHHNAQLLALELWNADATPRMIVGNVDFPDSASAGAAPPAWAHPDRATLGGFGLCGKEPVMSVAAPVRDERGILGHLVLVRRLSSAQDSMKLLRDLIGPDATILVRDGQGAWSDFERIVEGPPPRSGAPVLEYRDGGGRAWIATGEPLKGTDWQLWVRIPAATVTAKAEAFVARAAWIGAIVVLLGALGGWMRSRRITLPLATLTRAATAMAEGDLGQRVELRSRNELGALAAAFNAMAGRIREANEELERRIAARTAELASSEARFRSLASTAHDGIVAADRNGVVTFFNPGAERIFGYAAPEVLGRSLTELLPERYREEHEEGLARFRATGESSVIGRTVEMTGRRRDGAEFPMEVALAAWTTPEGREFAAILRDVSDRRRAEESLRKTAADLSAANEELNAFSYSVSHDLRAPLRAINGFSALLRDNQSARMDDDGRACLDRVFVAVKRMETLIDDLLELSHVGRQEMHRSPVDLGRVAEEVVAELRAASPDRAVDVQVAAGLVVTGDTGLLRLVLQNLLGNAWKFTAKHAEARIEVGVVEGAERTFFVRDDGAGFDMAYSKRLFGVFQRMHSVKDFPGTGVGLAIVQRIVQRHGGRMWAEAALEKGATFYFTLPGA